MKGTLWVWVLLATVLNTFCFGRYPDSLTVVRYIDRIGESARKGRIDSVEYYLDLSLEILEENDDLGNWYRCNQKALYSLEVNSNNVFRAHTLFLKAVRKAWRIPTNKSEWNRVGWYYIHLGYFYKQHFGDFTNSLKWYLKAENVFVDTLGTRRISILRYLYPPIGNNYTRKGDFEKALYYLNTFLDRCQEEEKYDYEAEMYNDISIVYSSLHEGREALRQLEMGLKLPDLSNFSKWLLYRRTAEVEMKLKRFDEAIRHEMTAERFYENALKEGDRRIIGLGYSHPDVLGRIYYEMGDATKAESYLKNAVDCYDSTYSVHNRREPAKIEIALGDALMKLGKNERALAAYHRALQRVLPAISSKSIQFIPPKEVIYPENTIAEALMGKAGALWQSYRANGNITRLNAAIGGYERMIDVWDKIRETFDYKSSHYNVLYENVIVIERALNACLAGWKRSGQHTYIQKAYHFIQKSKGILLNESLATTLAQIRAGIPDSLLHILHDYRIQAAHVEKRLFESGKETASEEEMKKDQRSLLQIKKEIGLINKQIEREFPQYYILKHKIYQANLENIRKSLGSDETMIEYFIGEKHIYLFKLDREDEQLIVLNDANRIRELVADFRKSIVQYWNLPLREQRRAAFDQNRDKIGYLGYELYRLLLEPAGDLKEKLVIVPDGYLGYLPFETLLVSGVPNGTKFRDFPYLNNRNTVSYCYSSVFLTSRGNTVRNIERLLAVAPVFGYGMANDNLSRKPNGYSGLIWNKKEVTRLKGIFPFRIMSGNQVSKKVFLDIAGQFDIIHMATHAVLQDKNSEFSYLSFGVESENEESGRLLVKDIFLLKLPASMVVLSACETGIGELHRGEGIMSLSRAFAHAGAKSLITSLWPVNDKASFYTMVSFYKQLKKGKTKDRALQLARQEYLSGQEDDMWAHPYFWGSFVPIGDMSPLVMEGQHLVWWIITGFVIIGFLLICCRTRYRV